MTGNDDKDRALQEELARLKAEHQRLRDEKLRTERDMDHLSAQLRDLQARAREEFGTSDPQELGALLAKRREENQAMVAEFRSHLESIRQGLEAVEREVDDPSESGAD